MSSRAGSVAIAFGAACGIAAVVSGTRESARMALGETGPMVVGEVTERDTSLSRGRRGRRHDVVETHFIAYRYVVGGRVYTSDGLRGSDRGYEVGEAVPVWYEKADPAFCISVAERNCGGSWGWPFLWAVLAAVLVVGGIVYIAARRGWLRALDRPI